MNSSAAARRTVTGSPDRGEIRRHRSSTLRLLRVSERAAPDGGGSYEPEGSERVSRGSVSLPGGGWWSAELSIALDDDRAALLRVIRTGAASDAPADDAQTELLFPVGEADALLALVAGVVRQARRDGVLPPPSIP